MDDYISRKLLLECIEEGWIKLDTEADTNRMIHLVRDIAPSVDAVEVVMRPIVILAVLAVVLWIERTV